MTLSRDTLVHHLDELLDPRHIRDYGPNGLQVEGRSEIKRIATASTASLAACHAAADIQADALLVHHGILWGKDLRITGIIRQRIAVLLQAGINLIAYHLPFDAHADVGNNAVIMRLLGAQTVAPFAEHHGMMIGWSGDLPQPLSAADFSTRLAAVFSHDVVHCPGSTPLIRRIGIVSGGGQSHLLDAAAAGCDALVTGEASEQSWHEAAESGCHLFACGHHATEDIAIHLLGERLAQQFQVEHRRLNVMNPI